VGSGGIRWNQEVRMDRVEEVDIPAVLESWIMYVVGRIKV